VALLIAQAPARAVTYEYLGSPLSSDTGNGGLLGHPIIFEFSTYDLLPANLSLHTAGQIGPSSSVPIINWSVSIGQYQASGVGNPQRTFPPPPVLSATVPTSE